MDENEFLEQVGQRIRQARVQLDLSQSELAERVGKTQNTISAYETGSRAMRIVELPLFADALNVPIAYLMGDEDLSMSYIQELYEKLNPPFDREAKRELERFVRLQQEVDESEVTGKPLQRRRPFPFSTVKRRQILRDQERQRRPEDVAYELFISARAVYTNTEPDNVRREISRDKFLSFFNELAHRYSNGEFSMKTFTTLAQMDDGPIEDILRHLGYIRDY